MRSICCPLCLHDKASVFFQEKMQSYYACSTCFIIFLDPLNRLDEAEERARYDLHRNYPDDPKYREFLERLCRPMVKRLGPLACGLDFGSGPGPTLSVMLNESGFKMSIYDVFYAPDSRVLKQQYDFITCTETAEHFFNPAEEFNRFQQMLNPGGYLGIMTEVPPEISFGDWYYRKDPTHVVFYSLKTFEWIAKEYGWNLEQESPSVYIFEKSAKRLE